MLNKNDLMNIKTLISSTDIKGADAIGVASLLYKIDLLIASDGKEDSKPDKAEKSDEKQKKPQ